MTTIAAVFISGIYKYLVFTTLYLHPGARNTKHLPATAGVLKEVSCNHVQDWQVASACGNLVVFVETFIKKKKKRKKMKKMG